MGQAQLVKILAIIFAAAGSYCFLRRLDFALHFIPLHAYGDEGRWRMLGIDTVFGALASLVAWLLAYVHFRCARESKVARAVLGWCWLLVLGFLAFVVHDAHTS